MNPLGGLGAGVSAQPSRGGNGFISDIGGFFGDLLGIGLEVGREVLPVWINSQLGTQSRDQLDQPTQQQTRPRNNRTTTDGNATDPRAAQPNAGLVVSKDMILLAAGGALLVAILMVAND